MPIRKKIIRHVKKHAKRSANAAIRASKNQLIKLLSKIPDTTFKGGRMARRKRKKSVRLLGSKMTGLEHKLIRKTHRTPKTVQAKLNKLRKAGRKLAKALPKVERPFYFNGTNQITTTGGKKMARRKRRKLSAKQAMYFGKRKTHRRKRHAVAMSGGYTTHRRRKHHSRRRYFGAEGSKLNIKHIAVNTVSAVGGGIVMSLLANKLPIADARIKAIIPILAGILLSGTKFGRSPMVQAASVGMVTVGGLSLVRTLVPTLPLLAGEEMSSIRYLGAPVQFAGGIPQARFQTPASF